MNRYPIDRTVYSRFVVTVSHGGNAPVNAIATNPMTTIVRCPRFMAGMMGGRGTCVNGPTVSNVRRM